MTMKTLCVKGQNAWTEHDEPATKIKRCPYCLGDDSRHIALDGFHHVECEHCGMRGPLMVNDNESAGSLRASAIDAWNGLPRSES